MPDATIARNEPAGTQLHLITLDIVLAEYTRPGQFVTAHVAHHKPAFFAITSSPGEPVQLLVKCQGDTAEALCAMKPGEGVELSEPMGKGFAMEDVNGRELLVLVNGSGISAARPVIRAEIAKGLPRPVHLFYGVLTPDRAAFREEVAQWAEAGVDAVFVVDPFNADTVGWGGATGYVQDVAAARGLLRDDVGLVLVGVKEMVETATRMWAEAGCPEERILVNY